MQCLKRIQKGVGKIFTLTGSTNKGFFCVFFGKGSKTGLKGKKINLQKDAVPMRGVTVHEESEVLNTKAAKEATAICVNSSNA